MSCGGGLWDPFNLVSEDPAVKARRDAMANVQAANTKAAKSAMTAQQQYLSMIQPYMEAGYQALPYMQSALYGGPQSSTVKTPLLDSQGRQIYKGGQPQFSEKTYTGNFDPSSNSLVQNELNQNLGDLSRQQMATGQSAGSGSALSQQAKVRANAYTNAYSRLADMVNGGRSSTGQTMQQVQGTGNTMAGQATNFGNNMANLYETQAQHSTDNLQNLLSLGSLGVKAFGAFGGGGLGSAGGGAASPSFGTSSLSMAPRD